MANSKGPASKAQLLVETVLLVLILAGVVHVIWFFLNRQFLPQPFVWDPQDTFMDFFNVAYWSHREGIYSVWRAVYPPLSFALLKLVSNPACYVSTPFAARECDLTGLSFIVLSYLGALLVSYRALRHVRPEVARWRILALGLGLPGLFVFERGNLLILCQLCLAIVVVPELGQRWSKALLAGVMINLKPYLVLPALSWAMRNDWRQLELAGIATIGIYLATWAIVGAGGPIELIENTTNWVDQTGTDIVFEMYYTTSFNNMFGVVDRGFPILRYLPSEVYEQFRASVEVLLSAAQASAVAAIALGIWRPRELPQARFALLLLLVSLVGRSPGGYSEFLVVFLVFLEPWDRWLPRIAIVLAYLISIPYEHLISALPPVYTASWLSGQSVTAIFGIGVSQFLRPLALLLILLALSWDTIMVLTLRLRIRSLALRKPEVAAA
jgi:Glycosyltransferase family 87